MPLLLIPILGVAGWVAWNKVQEIALPVAVIGTAAVASYLVYKYAK